MKVAFTGHRPEALVTTGFKEETYIYKNYDQHVAPVLEQTLFDTLSNLRHSIELAYNGLAIGVDDIACRAMQRLMIPYVAAIPFHGQGSNWPKSSRDQHQVNKDRASFLNITLTKENPEKWEICKSFLARDEYMVNNSDMLIAVWNPDIQEGGTYHTVTYANKKGKPVLNLWYAFCDRLEQYKSSLAIE